MNRERQMSEVMRVQQIHDTNLKIRENDCKIIDNLSVGLGIDCNLFERKCHEQEISQESSSNYTSSTLNSLRIASMNTIEDTQGYSEDKHFGPPVNCQPIHLRTTVNRQTRFLRENS